MISNYSKIDLALRPPRTPFAGVGWSCGLIYFGLRALVTRGESGEEENRKKQLRNRKREPEDVRIAKSTA